VKADTPVGSFSPDSSQAKDESTSEERVPVSKPADFNRDIYYRNKLKFSLDGGWLPINIPFSSGHFRW
jgi:hypothetical protein